MFATPSWRTTARFERPRRDFDFRAWLCVEQHLHGDALRFATRSWHPRCDSHVHGAIQTPTALLRHTRRDVQIRDVITTFATRFRRPQHNFDTHSVTLTSAAPFWHYRHCFDFHVAILTPSVPAARSGVPSTISTTTTWPDTDFDTHDVVPTTVTRRWRPRWDFDRRVAHPIIYSVILTSAAWS